MFEDHSKVSTFYIEMFIHAIIKYTSLSLMSGLSDSMSQNVKTGI